MTRLMTIMTDENDNPLHEDQDNNPIHEERLREMDGGVDTFDVEEMNVKGRDPSASQNEQTDGYYHDDDNDNPLHEDEDNNPIHEDRLHELDSGMEVFDIEETHI